MYQFTQKHKKVILLVVVVLLLPFIGISFYPLLSSSGRAGGVAGSMEIGGETFSFTRDDLRKEQRRLKAGGSVGVGGIPRDIEVDDVWLHLAQVKEAESLGVRVSDEQIGQQLQGIWQRQTQQTRQPFGKKEWKAALKRMKVRAVDVEGAMRDAMKKQELQFAYMTGTGVSMDNVLENFQEQNREVTVRAVRFGVDDLVASMKAVDFPLEPKLKEFYDDPANKPLLEAEEDLMDPQLFEAVEVLYAKIDAFDPAKLADYLKDEQPTDEEVQQAYEGLKFQLYRKGDEKKPKDQSQDTDKDAPPADDFKPFDEVKEDVKKRVLFRKFMQKLHREVRVAYDEAVAAAKVAKAAKDGEKKDDKKSDDPKDKKADEKDPPVALDLQAVANKYQGLVTFMKLGPLDRAGFDDLEPFKENAPYALAGHVGALSDGQLADSAYTNANSDFAFFARLMKQRPRRLKPIEEAEDALRKVAMRKAAREAAREKADAFYDAIKDAVKKAIQPELDKDVYQPLAAEETQAIADANAARKKDGKPALTEDDQEMKDLRKRFVEIKKLRETPMITKALPEKAGAAFDQVVAEMKLSTADYTFFEPPAPTRGDRNYDWGRRLRDAKRFPIKGFLRHNGVLRSLKKVNDVSGVVEDSDKASYVLKLVGVNKPTWDRIDPQSLKRARDMEQQAMMLREQAVGTFGPRSLTTRYRLNSNFRTQQPQGQ